MTGKNSKQIIVLNILHISLWCCMLLIHLFISHTWMLVPRYTLLRCLHHVLAHGLLLSLGQGIVMFLLRWQGVATFCWYCFLVFFQSPGVHMSSLWKKCLLILRYNPEARGSNKYPRTIQCQTELHIWLPDTIHNKKRLWLMLLMNLKPSSIEHFVFAKLIMLPLWRTATDMHLPPLRNACTTVFPSLE